MSTGASDVARGLFILLLVIVTLGLSAFSMLVTTISVTKYAISGGLLALVSWVIVNLRNRALVDKIEPVAALGGELNGG